MLPSRQVSQSVSSAEASFPLYHGRRILRRYRPPDIIHNAIKRATKKMTLIPLNLALAWYRGISSLWIRGKSFDTLYWVQFYTGDFLMHPYFLRYKFFCCNSCSLFIKDAFYNVYLYFALLLTKVIDFLTLYRNYRVILP